MIAGYLKHHSLTRMFSLRQDFSSALNRLVHSPAQTPVKIDLTDRHVPVFLRGRSPLVYAAKLAVRTRDGMSPGALKVSVNGNAVTGFGKDASLGGLYSVPLTAAQYGPVIGERPLAIVDPGALAPSPAPAGDVSVADAEKLLDLVLIVELRMP